MSDVSPSHAVCHLTDTNTTRPPPDGGHDSSFRDDQAPATPELPHYRILEFSHQQHDTHVLGDSHCAKKRSGQKPDGFWPLLSSVLWRCPTLPQPVGCSTIGAAGLSFQVRNGGWAFPRCYDHHKNVCSTRFPALLLCVGVWVDRGLYSGCGSIVHCVCVTRCVGLLFSVGPLVPVGSRAHYCASTSGLSTRSSGGGLSPHRGGVEISS